MEAERKWRVSACSPTLLLLGLIACVAPTAPVSAQCPFTDDFERPDSNTVGNGWVEIEKHADDCAIVSGYCQIRDRIPGGQITQSGIDTTGLQNITFRYEWRGNGISTAGDYLLVEWKRSDSGTWTTLGTHTLDQTTFTFESRALPADAEDTSIDIQFSVSVATKDHGAEVDNVEICAGECTIDDDCDDSDLCTIDTCANYTCYNDPVDCSYLDDDCNVGVCNTSSGACESQTANEGLPCDDGDVCNVGETCQTGSCVGGAAPDCSGAGDQCNDASCDTNGLEGNCDTLTPTNEGLPCDDGDVCNVGETCQSGSCAGGAAVSCDEFDEFCADYECDTNGAEGNCDAITPLSEGLPCDDGDVCLIGETCQTGTCTGGAAVNCDGVDTFCADYECDTNGAEGNCAAMTPLNEGLPCDDGLFCIENETCQAGSCAGDARDCGDAVGCTDDTCDEDNDVCVNTANDANCPDDGVFCNGTEYCDAVQDCISTGFPCGGAEWCEEGGDTCIAHGDGDVNTNGDVELADYATFQICFGQSALGGCEAVNMTGETGAIDVDDYILFAEALETCSTNADCYDWNPCTTDICSNGVCVNTPVDDGTPCSDGDFCNGPETCIGGTCQPGTDPCLPEEYCNEETDTCDECLIDDQCDDGNACTIDTCVAAACSYDCPATISSYPYTEDFEAGFGDWRNVPGDDFDWTRISGPTPTGQTGPSGDHTTGTGFYVYTDASYPNRPDKTALLEGPCFELSGVTAVTLTFWYHMYGWSMGTLNVDVSENCTDWVNVWTLSGDQGDTWFQANVDLSAYVDQTITIRFRGVTGDEGRSDMAVDDISVTATP